jgi:hypothetical protein
MSVPTIAPAGNASASNVYQNNGGYSADKAVDGNGGTRWATDDGVKSAWLQIDFPKPRRIGGVSIDESYARVTKFWLEYEQNGQWKPFFTGTTIGSNFKRSFTPVTVKRVRLNILDSAGGPTINEIQFDRAAEK